MISGLYCTTSRRYCIYLARHGALRLRTVLGNWTLATSKSRAGRKLGMNFVELHRSDLQPVLTGYLPTEDKTSARITGGGREAAAGGRPAARGAGGGSAGRRRGK